MMKETKQSISASPSSSSCSSSFFPLGPNNTTTMTTTSTKKKRRTRTVTSSSARRRRRHPASIRKNIMSTNELVKLPNITIKRMSKLTIDKQACSSLEEDPTRHHVPADARNRKSPIKVSVWQSEAKDQTLMQKRSPPCLLELKGPVIGSHNQLKGVLGVPLRNVLETSKIEVPRLGHSSFLGR